MTDSKLPSPAYFEEQAALQLLVPRARLLAALADALGTAPAGDTVTIPRAPTTALLRPFISCPEAELPEAWEAMLRIAATMAGRAVPPAAPGEIVKAIREYLGVHPDLQLGGQVLDRMALELSGIALDYPADLIGALALEELMQLGYTVEAGAILPPRDLSEQACQFFGVRPVGRAHAAAAPHGERQWICPTRTVADLVNKLLTMDQGLPIYGAQYIEIAGRRRAVAVPPTVSRERVKDGLWIGQGEELNAAVVWTRAEQPAAVAGLALSLVERQAVDALCAVALAARHVADDSPYDSNGTVPVEHSDMEALIDALDKLDSLPDDQPGYLMDPAAKAAWALRRLLDAPPALEVPAALAAKPDGMIAVPFDLVVAACSAIDKKRDAPKILAELRRYTTGDLSRAQAAPAAPVTPAAAMAALKAAFASDPEYAWSWHCGAWACAHDEGLDTGAANRAAARLMHMAFGCDTSKHPNFLDAHRKAAPAAPAADASDTALLDAMERRRIAVAPEFDGPWDAELYGEGEEPLHVGSGATPREALRAALAALAAQAKEDGGAA